MMYSATEVQVMVRPAVYAVYLIPGPVATEWVEIELEYLDVPGARKLAPPEATEFYLETRFESPRIPSPAGKLRVEPRTCDVTPTFTLEH